MHTIDPFSSGRPANETRDSLFSLHTVPDSAASANDPMAPDDEDDIDDAISTHSSRSDKSLETAGLVSRMSGEGIPRSDKSAAARATPGANGLADSEAEETYDSNVSGLSRDRGSNTPSSSRRRSSRRKNSVFARTWHISREVSRSRQR
jgi:hypothetical protein